MKSEHEIRMHRDDLLLAMQQPCGCAGTGHEWECQAGREMMIAAIRSLSWALGEDAEHEEVVEQIHGNMVKARTGK